MPDPDDRSLFLPGVPADLVQVALAQAGGNELGSGKFASPESSAALAANGFGWFMAANRAACLPRFPCLSDLDWPVQSVQIERQMRFPWSGGRHPWLDAALETPSALIGVESKRYEPFRAAKPATLSEAYDRDCWGEGMAPWCAMRDRLRAEPRRYRHLDAAQLVKHALGLATEAGKAGKQPVLLYLFAEPSRIAAAALARHRAEIADFSARISGARVRFAACSWREWLAGWDGQAAEHSAQIIDRFQP